MKKDLLSFGLVQTSAGVELCLCEPVSSVRLQGVRFSSAEGPSVVIGGRKQPVEDIY
ncbi:Uncharacterised protein [uncultured archaeon]|nr:Uncharacterised protein [uncultured archaeon]